MTETLLPIAVAIASLVLGHVLTRAWDRARPFIAIRGFEPIYRKEDLVFVDEELAELTGKLWSTCSLPRGERPVTELVDTYQRACDYLRANDDGQSNLSFVIHSLQEASSGEDVINAIKTLLTNDGLRSTLEMLMVTGQATLPEKDAEGHNDTVKAFATDEHDGSFFVELPGTYVRLGSSLPQDKAVSERLRPLVNILRRGDREALVQVLKTASCHMKEQLVVAHRIVALFEPILHGYRHWMAKIVLVNYGKSSFVFWPEVLFEVRSKELRGRLTLECLLMGVGADSKLIEEPAVVPPDGSLILRVVTKERQMELEHGELLDALYAAGSARAAARFKITHRNSPRGTSVLSKWIEFR